MSDEKITNDEEMKKNETEKEVEQTIKPNEEKLAEETGLIENDSDQKQNILKNKKIWMIAGGVIACILLLYVAVSLFFKDHLLMNTYVNGIDCSMKLVGEVETIFEEEMKKYVLQISTRSGNVEEIRGTDIDMTYEGHKDLEEVFEQQNAFLWPVSVFRKQNIETKTKFSYDEEKLKQQIKQLDCVNPDNQVAPVNATVVCEAGIVSVQKEELGSQIDSEILNTVINEAVSEMKDSIQLEEAGAYVAPKYTTESAEIASAKSELEKYLSASITYSLDSIVVNVNKDLITDWISVNENLEPVISTEKVRAFADTLGDKYNIADTAEELVTPTGKVVSMPNAHKGRKVGAAAETEQLISEIKEGKTVTRKPVLSQEGTPNGQKVWGTTYIEVDITQQHMWYIQNGSVTFECDIVTGKPGHNTPTGVFTILEKLRNKVLRGDILPNGEREYETPVSYWARVTWSGIGFHDATWQSAFGGQRYLQGYGSHGCINMPLDKVQQFYGMISVGEPVIIHN